MAERVMADSPICFTCAARTRSSEGFVCEPRKLGSSNKSKGKNK